MQTERIWGGRHTKCMPWEHSTPQCKLRYTSDRKKNHYPEEMGQTNNMFGPSLQDNVFYRQNIRRKHALTGFCRQSRLLLMAPWSYSEERKRSILKVISVHVDVKFDLILRLNNSEISEYAKLVNIVGSNSNLTHMHEF